MQDQQTSTDIKQPQRGSNGKWVSKESLNAITERGSDLLSRVNLSPKNTGMILGGVVIGFALGIFMNRRQSIVS